MYLGQSTFEEASLDGVGRQSDRLAVGGGPPSRFRPRRRRSPHSARRVSATCASVASDGWQHVKISRSWSSRTPGSSRAPGRSSCGGRGRVAIAVGAPGYVTLPPR